MKQNTDFEPLLKCLNIIGSGASQVDLGKFTQNDWELIYENSTQQAIAPYLCYRLTKLEWIDQVPFEVREKLRERTLFSARNKIKIERETREVLSALNAADIPVIVLKGAHLAEIVYDEPALRPFDDVDLLVFRQDFLACDKALLELGYGPSRRNWIEHGLIESHHHIPRYLNKNFFSIEIHWTITNQSRAATIDPGRLWNRAQPARIAGVDVLVLSPEDLLLHLIVHTCINNLFVDGLRQLIDISETLELYKDDMDWEQVIQHSHEWGIGKCVYLTLYLTQDMLGTNVPDQVLESLKPEHVSPQVFTSAKEQIINHEPLSRNFARLWGSEEGYLKATTLLGRIFLSPGDMYRKYSVEPGTAGFYRSYLRRMKDLAIRYGGLTLGMLRGDQVHMTTIENENVLTDWLESG